MVTEPAPTPATITQSTDQSMPHLAVASATAAQPLDRGRDLSQNRAGDGVRETARAKFREAPVRNLLQRIFRDAGDDKSWRQGLRGEIAVGRALESAMKPRSGWRLLHSIRRNVKGTDVDHLLIGPGGIFSINAKFHEGKRVWLGERTILVGRTPQPHLGEARNEARQVKRVLDAAYPTPREVTPVVVIAGSASFSRGKTPPGDVVVIHVSEIPEWFESMGEPVRQWEVDALYDVARWERTWLSSAADGPRRSS